MIAQGNARLKGIWRNKSKKYAYFYEAWDRLDCNSSVQTDELPHIGSTHSAISPKVSDNKTDTIHQFELMNLENFPVIAFMSISFTHHITILTRTKDYDERLFYIKYCADFKLDNETLERIIRQDLYHHQANMPTNVAKEKIHQLELSFAKMPTNHTLSM